MRAHAVINSLITSTLAICTLPCLAQSNQYPTKPIRIITSTVGGSTDIATRIMAIGLPAALGQPVVVENQGGMLSADAVSRANPDGYTLLATGNLLWTLPLLGPVSYDPVKDFAPIVLTHTTPMVLAVPASVPVNSLKEFIALARSKPGQLNYAAGAPGSTNHLAGAMFVSMANINVVAVPYKGGGPALNAVVAGEVQMLAISAAAVLPQIKSGKLKGLGVTSGKPSALVPGMPTVAVAGDLPSYKYEITLGVLAPANTNAAIINRLNKEFVQVLRRPDLQEKFLAQGLEAVGSTPNEFAALIKSDMAEIGKVIKEANIKAE